MVDLNHITAEKMQVLNQVVEQALKNSANVFSEMVGQEITISAPAIKMVPLNSVADDAGGPETVGTGIYMGLAGEGCGHVILFFTEQSVYKLLDMILELEQGTTTTLEDMEISALAELGNVTGSCFLNSMADRVGMELVPTAPAVALDMLGAILSGVLAELATSGSQALLVETTFQDSNQQQISGYFFLLPEPETLSNILARLEG